MTDAPAKKRGWFQVHLSTCVVLMCVAGALVWANVRNQAEGVMELVGDVGLYGWPYYCYASWYQQHTNPQSREIFLVDEGEGRTIRQFSYKECAADLGVALIILGLTALVCEFNIYRRARKREAKDPAP